MKLSAFARTRLFAFEILPRSNPSPVTFNLSQRPGSKEARIVLVIRPESGKVPASVR